MQAQDGLHDLMLQADGEGLRKLHHVIAYLDRNHSNSKTEFEVHATTDKVEAEGLRRTISHYDIHTDVVTVMSRYNTPFYCVRVLNPTKQRIKTGLSMKRLMCGG